jgi:hypothetical protein
VSNVVHAVLAAPPGVNVGMAAVDLGIASVAREAGVRVIPRRHPSLQRRQETLTGAAQVRSRMDVGLGDIVPLRALPTREEGRLVYWGDFQHMKRYLEEVASLDGRGGRAGRLWPRRRARSFARTLELLVPGDAELGPVQSFGTTLLFNSAHDLAAGAYSDALSAFVNRCTDLWLRDPISTAMARRLTAGEHVRLGVDPALLADRPVRDSNDGRVAVFLGRTPAAHPALVEAANRLARHLDTLPQWLEWGCGGAFPGLATPEIRRALGALASAAPPAREVLGQLAGARAVVTDSYHLALIAWSWGVPAITIAAPVETGSPASVDGGRPWSWRDKREMAASQYGALDLVIRPEEWADPRRLNRRLGHIRQALATDLVAAIRAAITNDARRARSEILASWSRPSEPDHARHVAVAPRAVRAVAIVAVRNELPHIDGLVRHLVLEGLDVVVIDHESSDGSFERAQRWVNRGVLRVDRRRFDGVFDLGAQLQWKQDVISELDHDWVMHVDGDEWPHARRPHERLTDLFARADAAGDTAVNFEEFVFVPDVELHAGHDPREVFCSYYYFAPVDCRLMRAWRRDARLTNRESGGHTLMGGDVRVHSEDAVLRHYPVLSSDHASQKYSGRRFSREDLALRWHTDRMGLTEGDFVLRPGPALRRLSRWDSRDFDRSAPVSRHYWQRGWPDTYQALSRGGSQWPRLRNRSNRPAPTRSSPGR